MIVILGFNENPVENLVENLVEIARSYPKWTLVDIIGSVFDIDDVVSWLLG